MTLWEIVTVLIIPSGGFAFWLCWNEIKALRRKSHLHDSHITALLLHTGLKKTFNGNGS